VVKHLVTECYYGSFKIYIRYIEISDRRVVACCEEQNMPLAAIDLTDD